ncbi:MAG: TetR/AcrR family transcriptional regulator [Thermoflexales bacterium]|nr:TetR/AcrR family transcriptional regulator [Thermoflexales bacterium]
MAEQQEAADRRKQILEAAVAVFAERGYQRATVKEIAARAGVAPGTIYLYFRNKRELLLALAETLIRRAADTLLAPCAELDVGSHLALILRDRLRFVRENQGLLRALATEIWTDRELAAQFFGEVILPVIRTGSAYTQERVVRGELRSFRAEIILPAVVGGILLISVLRLMSPNSPTAALPEEEVVEELVRFYLYGLRSHPEAQWDAR